VATSARAVYVMVAGARAGEAAERLAHRVVAEASRDLGDTVFAAVSSERTGARSLPRLRDEIDQILRVNAGGMSAPAVATMTDVQSAVMLLHVRDELERHPELQHAALRDLIEHDREHGGDLAVSLLVWLEAGQNVQSAANRLHVHANTLRYRLRRIREIAPIDLEDPDQRLAAWLELRLRGELTAPP
jgi:DNA-binding PucR family transcriptional regulator